MKPFERLRRDLSASRSRVFISIAVSFLEFLQYLSDLRKIWPQITNLQRVELIFLLVLFWFSSLPPVVQVLIIALFFSPLFFYLVPYEVRQEWDQVAINLFYLIGAASIVIYHLIVMSLARKLDSSFYVGNGEQEDETEQK